ncbi:MAG: TRAP transporter substrate-binding protein [Pseudomonadota bacterium]
MNHVKRFIAAGAILASSAIGAWAQDTTLRISSWLPPAHHLNTVVFPGLISMMEEATDGAVSGEIVFGLAPPPAQMDLVLDGAADIAFIFHGYQPGRYVSTRLIELPGYEGNAEAASVAYWRVFEEHLASLNEHRGVKVISVQTHGPGQIHAVGDVTSLADLDGLKTRIGGGIAGDVGAALGVVGINVPAPRVYETLDSGAADAVAMDVGSRLGFRLNEVTSTLFEIPGGFYRGSFAIVLSQEAFDALPEDVQSALDAEVFGEPLSRMSGAAWDATDVAAYEATRAADGAKVVTASAEDVAAFEAISMAVREKTLAGIAEKGVDAQAAYDMVVEEMANVMAEGS